jgi:short-subunit dehydrogenase
VETVVADLATAGGAEDVAVAVRQAGLVVDLLVNNAGAGLHGSFVSTPLERELQMLQLNAASVLQLIKAFLPGMVQRGSGHIVNVASVAAFLPGPYQSVYYATKAFVLSISEALAEELRGTGVWVTAVCPGPTSTGFHASAGVRRARPLSRRVFLSPEAVAEAAFRGVRARRRLVVPGWKHRLLVLAIQLAPRRLVAWASERAGRPEG